jgi:protein involved in polysaccharide export with SLBB domain
MISAFHNSRWLSALLAALLPAACTGCRVLDVPQAATSQSSAFAWLTNWTGQPMDAAPGFDVESLRPDPRLPAVAPGELLEVTVWDLNEPGQAYTFPVRVTERRTIEVPLLGELPVADRSCAQVEAGLIDGYRTGEFLVNPRVLVRSLDPSRVKVQVSGALLRPGYVELSRTDTSVYAALVSAGGLRKSAGTQVGIVRRSDPAAYNRTMDQVRRRLDQIQATVATRSADGVSIQETSAASPAEQHANLAETLSVDADRTSPSEAAGEGKLVLDRVADDVQTGRGEFAAREHHHLAWHGIDPFPEQITSWFDAARPEDQAELRKLKLRDGDEVIVKATVPPVRVGGVVERPGAYPIPPGSAMDVWQAIDRAGGVRTRGVPLNITLIHPASDGRPAKRWFVNVSEYDDHPAESPVLEPGDVVHVEPTAGGKIKRVVGELWKQP